MTSSWNARASVWPEKIAGRMAHADATTETLGELLP